ncbi:hypothetical protein [Microvirga makkahensis]|uniref:Uncharacterized protein n=1 Tax=Microvirga makkahensis TaxID=1128670 RepID=A0A7X3MU38_9HYPH|nr:hypothetical protein [Microvirga makkahensis]MXQ13237.1 hypothetical protein [Microvirga makkahensis]
MSRRKPLITQADVSRAVKGAQSAGLKVQRVEVDPATGRIVVVSGDDLPVKPLDEFEAWKAKGNAHSA